MGNRQAGEPAVSLHASARPKDGGKISEAVGKEATLGAGPASPGEGGVGESGADPPGLGRKIDLFGNTEAGRERGRE